MHQTTSLSDERIAFGLSVRQLAQSTLVGLFFMMLSPTPFDPRLGLFVFFLQLVVLRLFLALRKKGVNV
jgi:hypothetical protein